MGISADWVTSIATCFGAVAAFGAAIGTVLAVNEAKKSTTEAAKSAKAAQASAELQRPRPVLVVEYNSQLRTYPARNAANSFVVRNIGASPAFDVDLSPLRLPNDGKAWLATKSIPVIPPGDTPLASHSLEPNGSMIDPLVSSYTRLAEHAGLESASSIFSLTYTALDGRRFEVGCKLIVDPLAGVAQAQPIASWLGRETFPAD